METKFSCTQCGHCCHDNSLLLTIAEAIAWLDDGGKVSLYCEAELWPKEPPSEDLQAAYRQQRSFAAVCGAAKIRVTALLIGVVTGACRNLGENMQCRIYERRPLVCRIYPAEINPFIEFSTAKKGCPPEAWTSGRTLLSDGNVVDTETQSRIEQARNSAASEAAARGLLCGDLNIDIAAIAGQGFAKHEPDQTALLAALRRARLNGAPTSPVSGAWRLYSPSTETTASLEAKGFGVMAHGFDNSCSFLSAPR